MVGISCVLYGYERKKQNSDGRKIKIVSYIVVSSFYNIPQYYRVVKKNFILARFKFCIYMKIELLITKIIQ